MSVRNFAIQGQRPTCMYVHVFRIDREIRNVLRVGSPARHPVVRPVRDQAVSNSLLRDMSGAMQAPCMRRVDTMYGVRYTLVCRRYT